MKNNDDLPIVRHKLAAALSIFLGFYQVNSYAAINRPPVISGPPSTQAVEGTAYIFTPTASDPDNDPLTFSISNKPAWLTFDPQTGILTGTPARAHVAPARIITITVKDNKGRSARLTFKLQVLRLNQPPTISGTPQAVAQAGVAYKFTPIAADPDKDRLKFSIANKPAWAVFNVLTGVLSGTPRTANIGTTNGIVISVNDGYGGNKSLPAFNLSVVAKITNQPPTITGNAAISVNAGAAYNFAPVASDPDGDSLTFSIGNKPAWASFSTGTGALTGTPTASDVGTTSTIVISVSDGKGGTASLAAFDLTVAQVNGQIPDLVHYSFTGQETKVLPGESSDCNGTIASSDQIGRLALMALFYQNACYTDGSYNHNNYGVERGVMSNSANSTQFEAYRIAEPTSKATQFLASEHVIYYQFPTKEDYSVYQLAGDAVSLVKQVSAADISITSAPVKVATLTVSKIKGTVTYVFVPKSQRVSSFTELGTGIEGARVNSTALGDVIKYRYTVSGRPFDTKLDFNNGPSTHSNVYSRTRQFFLVTNSNGQRGVVWQDKDDASIQVTWLGSNLKTQQTLDLPFSTDTDLVAATADNLGNLYYLTLQKGSGVNGSGDIARVATLFKTNAAGQELLRKTLDTTTAGLNIVSFGDGNVASLQHVNGTLGLIIGRQMHRSSDGLNHQGAIAVVFDANTLSVTKNWGQTSGHSFESVLATNAQNEFVGIDLGDNYPRGVNLHKFTQSTKRSRVVYTFKTQHGTTATSPAGATYPVYPEISNATTTYYKWSNDNRTYTELGGVTEGSNGYSVVFSGENTADGRALDNARVGNYLNDARNIGLVQVRKDFENATGSSAVISDDLVKTMGAAETGGFYTFGGGWSEQRNRGIVWLTAYQDKSQENVSRLRTVKLADGNLLLLWEKWTPDAYVNTYAIKVDEAGNALSQAIALGSYARINRRDDVWQFDNQIYWVSGDSVDKKLELMVLQLK